jgi:Uma2 family endonuclease
MAQPTRPRHRYSYAEYLEYERDSGLKHEYDDGDIVATPSGSRHHNALALRVGAALDAARSSGCIAFQSDQKIRVLATGRATYPDATVVCACCAKRPHPGRVSAPPCLGARLAQLGSMRTRTGISTRRNSVLCSPS